MVRFVGVSAWHSHSDTNVFHHLYGKGSEKTWTCPVPNLPPILTNASYYNTSMTVCHLQLFVHCRWGLEGHKVAVIFTENICIRLSERRRLGCEHTEAHIWEWRRACRQHFKIHPTNQHTRSYTFFCKSLSSMFSCN